MQVKVKAITEFSYDMIDRKPGDLIDMADGDALALQIVGKVVKAEDDAQEEPTKQTRGNRYKTRHLRAEG